MKKITKTCVMVILSLVILFGSVFGAYKKAYAIEWVALWTAEEVVYTLLGILGVTFVGAEAIEDPGSMQGLVAGDVLENIVDFVDSGKFAEANQALTDNKEYVMNNMQSWLDEVIEHGMYYGELCIDTKNACWTALKAWVQDLLGGVSDAAESPERIHEPLPDMGNTSLTQAIFSQLPYLTTAQMELINSVYADSGFNAVSIYKFQNVGVTYIRSYVSTNIPCSEYIYWVCAYNVPDGGSVITASRNDNIMLSVLDSEGTQVDRISMYSDKVHDFAYRVDIHSDNGKPIYPHAPSYGTSQPIQDYQGTKLQNGIITGYVGSGVWYDISSLEGDFIYSTVPLNGMVVSPEQTLLPDWVGHLKTGEAVDQLIQDDNYVDNYDIFVPGQSDIARDGTTGALVVTGDITVPVQDIPVDNTDVVSIPGVIPVDLDKEVVIDSDTPIEDVIDTPIEKPTEINGQKIEYSGLTTVFPFCIPFDLVRCIQLLNASPTPPEWRYTLRVDSINFEYTFVINFDAVRPLVLIFRSFMLLLFVVALIMATRGLIKG